MGSEQAKPPAPRVPDGAVVELTICNDLVNATATAFDAAGKEIELPARIEVRPQFLSPNALVGISRCRVLGSKDNVTTEKSSGMLRVSGVNGKMQIEPIRPQMLPKFMMPEKPKAPPADPPDPAKLKVE